MMTNDADSERREIRAQLALTLARLKEYESRGCWELVALWKQEAQEHLRRIAALRSSRPLARGA